MGVSSFLSSFFLFSLGGKKCVDSYHGFLLTAGLGSVRNKGKEEVKEGEEDKKGLVFQEK